MRRDRRRQKEGDRRQEREGKEGSLRSLPPPPPTLLRNRSYYSPIMILARLAQQYSHFKNK